MKKVAKASGGGKSLFNAEFDFEAMDDFSHAFHMSQPVGRFVDKSPVTREQEGVASNDDDEDALDDFDSNAVDSKTTGSAANQTIPNQKDHVRIKTQSLKKKETNDDEFFELPAEVAEGGADPTKITSFDQMNLSKPLIKALEKMGLSTPTPIQLASVPTGLLGKDICACAVTGSGKTLAFMLPTLERLLYKPKFPQVTRVLVLTPTRELAAQICKVTRDLTHFTSINTCLCAGGFDLKTQEAALRMGPDIVIATPGRLIDHLHNTPCFNLDTVEVLILDEADRMLDECFAEQLKEVMRLCSTTRQTMLFSATMTDKVADLVNVSLNRPVKIFLNENVDVTPYLKQEFVRLRDTSERNREALLAALIQRKFNERVIVFVRTKMDCHRICLLLNMLDIMSAELHGGLTQTQRLDKLNEFKENKLSVMVATDLAARGLDIADVKTVINFAMPMTFKHYIHRVGRTARAQHSGRSISLVGENDRWLVKEIVRSSKEPVKCRVIPPDVIEFYREKVDSLRDQLIAKLNEEKNDVLIDKMEKDINKAQKRISSEDNRSSMAKKGKKSNGEPSVTKRSWLTNVDYKTGALLSDMKDSKKAAKGKSGKSKRRDDVDDNDDSEDGNAKKHKKKKFLTKHHKEQHDNIFSKKFKNNQINTTTTKRRKK